MPEFQLDYGSDRAVAVFKSLDAFTQGCIAAMFFTECHADNPELKHATVDDLAPETMAEIIADCRDFQAANAATLDLAYVTDQYDSERAGNDYWYTRNHDGTGYWDRRLPDTVGIILTNAAHAAGTRDLYRGDDGKLYLA